MTTNEAQTKLPPVIVSTPSVGSVATFICEVGVVDTTTHTTGWREVARYADEEEAMNYVGCNSHCVCRYRKETPPNAAR